MSDTLHQFENENKVQKQQKFIPHTKCTQKNNPGKLVINSINCHFFDHHLQPLK